MKRFFLSVCVVGGIMMAGGCDYEQLQPSFKSQDTFADGTMQSAPNFAQFREIPVPEKATMDLKKTMLFGNDPLIGRLAFSAPYSQSNLFDFYMQEMPKFGWKEVTVIRSSNSFLTFAKDNRIATIQLSTTAVSGTDVIFDISIAKNQQSGY
ncbi:MAG: hypothetical protein ACI4QM_05210 [Alphaproteobacteria bacterium]